MLIQRFALIGGHCELFCQNLASQPLWQNLLMSKHTVVHDSVWAYLEVPSAWKCLLSSKTIQQKEHARLSEASGKDHSYPWFCGTYNMDCCWYSQTTKMPAASPFACEHLLQSKLMSLWEVQPIAHLLCNVSSSRARIERCLPSHRPWKPGRSRQPDTIRHVYIYVDMW